MNNYCVYKHTSPSGKVYVGITKLKPKYMKLILLLGSLGKTILPVKWLSNILKKISL